MIRRNFIRVFGLSVFASLFAWTATVQAGDTGDTFKAVLEDVKKDKDGKPVVRRLFFSGATDGFPQGTRVDIRFRLRGNNQHIAWYRALADDKGKIKGKSSLLNKPFAPGTYEVQFWLKLRTQSRDVQKWFLLNRGWGRKHSELLENVTIVIGTAGEHQDFVNKSIGELRDYMLKVAKIVAPVQTMVRASKPYDKSSEAEITKIKQELTATNQAYYKWERVHLAIPLERFRKRYSGLTSRIARLVIGYFKGQRLEGLEGICEDIDADVKYLKEILIPGATLEVDAPKKKR